MWACVAALPIVVLLSACSGAQAPEKSAAELDQVAFIRPEPVIVRDVDFAQPAAAIHDPVADIYLVSNINGDPTQKDDNGFISQVGADGKVINLKWIDGGSFKTTLHAPKGMAVFDSRLFVADIDVVRIFHRTTGAALGVMQVPKAKFLNGVSVAPNGTLYVSDTGLKKSETGQGWEGLEPSGSDAVHQISKWGFLKRIAKGDDLHRPSGLAADDDGVWVASWLEGDLYRISKNGKRQDPVKAPASQLQGLVRLPDGTTLLSSWKTQAVYVGHPGGSSFSLVADHAPTAGGVGYDAKRRRALIPLLNEGVLIAQELSGFEETSSSVADE